MSQPTSPPPSNIRNLTEEMNIEQDSSARNFRSEGNTAKSSISTPVRPTEDKQISKYCPSTKDHKRLKVMHIALDERKRSNRDKVISTSSNLSPTFLNSAPSNQPCIVPRHILVLENCPNSNSLKYSPSNLVSPSPMESRKYDRYKNSEHCAIQKARMTLAMQEDAASLNSLHCSVRSKLLEIFVTGSESNYRVGIRCIHCSHIRRQNRDIGSVQYPRSLGDIYASVCTWQHIHFKNCRHVPSNILKHYTHLKNEDRTQSNENYWSESAKKMGLVDDAIISSSGFTCADVNQRNNMCIEDLDHERENPDLEKGIRFLDISCMSKHIKKKCYKRDGSSLSIAAASLRPRVSKNGRFYRETLPRFRM